MYCFSEYESCEGEPWEGDLGEAGDRGPSAITIYKHNRCVVCTALIFGCMKDIHLMVYFINVYDS